MPNYRQAGSNAFSGLSDFFGMLLQQRMQEEQRRKQQAEQRAAQMQAHLMEKLSTPEVATRAQEMGLEDVGGLPIGLFAPSDREQSSEMMKAIGNANTLSSLPTNQEAVGQLNIAGVDTTPGVEKLWNRGGPDSLPSANYMPASVGPTRDVLSSLQAKRDNLTRHQVPTKISGYDPVSGNEYDEYVPNADLTSRGQIQTAPTPSQKGSNWLEEQENGQLSPGAIAGLNRVEAGTRGEKVRTAASTASASTRARLAAELDPQVIAAQVEKTKRLAVAEALQASDLEGAKEAAASSRNAVPVLTNIARMKELYNAVKTTSTTEASLRAVGTHLGPIYQAANPQAAELDSLRKAVAPLFFTLFGGKGQQSDKDIAGILSAIPGSSTLPETGDAQWRDLEAMVTVSPLAATHLRHLPVSERVRIATEWARLIRSAPAGVTSLRDPQTGVVIPILSNAQPTR